MLVAAVVLEAISCLQYFYSREAIRQEAERRAQSELRRAELEIDAVTIEMEAATKMLVTLAERYIDNPDSIAGATRTLLQTIENVSSAGVACEPNLFPQKGRWYERCSSREMKDGEQQIYTRQIGGEHHDYLQTEWYHSGLTIDSCWWSEPYYDDLGAQAMIVSCTHPIRNKQGQIVAVACVDLSLAYLENVSEYLKIYQDSYYCIRSGKGQQIVTGDDTIPGRKYQSYDEFIEKTGWSISIVIPEDVIFADLNRIGMIVGILMLLGLALLVFIMWHAGKNVLLLIDSTARNQSMEKELHIAKTIQMAMLPNVFPPFRDRLDLNIYGMINPAKEIGGDLYDFYIRHDKLFFCIGDVSGKGVPAALVMAMTRSLFRSISSHEERPEVIVSMMNKALTDQNTENMFLTLFIGVMNRDTGELVYCNAGHCAPVLMSGRQAAIRELDIIPNLPVGIVDDFAYQAQTTTLQHDDILFLYTDGLTEAENSKHEQYGEQRMMAQLQASVGGLRPRTIADNMEASIRKFVGDAEQSDDLTMLVIRYQTPAIIMRNDIQQIPTLAEWVDGLGLPDELNMPVNLALEEAASNVMLYAYPEGKGDVIIEFGRMKKDGQEAICFTISDRGIAFDPTKQAEVDTTKSAEERPIGGLGIHLVRQLMDEVSYERVDESNVLRLVKLLNS